MDNNVIRATTRLPEELYNKIVLFKKEDDLKTINASIIKLIELGLIRYQEETFKDDLLLKIFQQLNYIIGLLEENTNE